MIMKNCPKCGAVLSIPAHEIPEGLSGVKYESCNNCGWTRAVTRKPKRERVNEARD